MSSASVEKPQKNTSKSKKQLLLELLELEDDNLGELKNSVESKNEAEEQKIESITSNNDDDEPITKPKRKLSEKQLEALKKGQQKRDENRDKRKAEAKLKEDEEKRILEEKLVKKAIAVKKKQIKKQAILDEISDDETPIQKIKEKVQKMESKAETITQPPKPKIKFV